MVRAHEERDDPIPVSLRDVVRGPGARGVFGLFRRVFDYLVRLNGTPEAIAWGLALGLFVAMTPSVGFQTLIVVPIAGLLRVNKAAAAVGVWLTNPLTIPFFYSLTYYVGAWLLGHPLDGAGVSHHTFHDLLSAAPHVLASCLLGGVVLGAVIALGSYLPVLFTIRAARATALAAARRRRQRRLERERRLAAEADGADSTVLPD